MASDSLASVSRVAAVRLPELLEWIRRGELRFAAFHRPLVWTIDMQLALLESVVRGLPIGVIAVWRTRRPDVHARELLGPPRSPQQGRWDPDYILDGQQRLATLLHALFPVDVSTSMRGEREFYYDLVLERFQLSPKPTSDAERYLPLGDILSTTRFVRFQRDLIRGLWHVTSTESEMVIIERSDRVARAFQDYQIPVVTLATDDLAFVARSFENVNARGVPMSSLHMVNAFLELSYGQSLTSRMDGLIDELLTDVGARETVQETLLRICKIPLGSSPRDDVLVRALGEEPEILDRAAQALLRAARFFAEEMSIPTIDLVPYTGHVALVASLLLDRPEPDRQFWHRLGRWIWCTTYAELLSGLSSGAWHRLLDEARSICDGQPLVAEAGDAPVRKPLGRFDYRRPRSRALTWLLASREPIDPAADASAGAKMRLILMGAEAVPRLVDGGMGRRDLAQSSGARVLLPAASIKVLRQVLGDSSMYQGDFAALLHSHFIPQEAQQAFAAGDHAEFIRLREELLNQVEQQRFEECVNELSRAASQ